MSSIQITQSSRSIGVKIVAETSIDIYAFGISEVSLRQKFQNHTYIKPSS